MNRNNNKYIYNEAQNYSFPWQIQIKVTFTQPASCVCVVVLRLWTRGIIVEKPSKNKKWQSDFAWI